MRKEKRRLWEEKVSYCMHGVDHDSDEPSASPLLLCRKDSSDSARAVAHGPHVPEGGRRQDPPDHPQLDLECGETSLHLFQ